MVDHEKPGESAISFSPGRYQVSPSHHVSKGTSGPFIGSPLLQLSNLDYHDAAFLPPRVGEVDGTDPASLAKAIGELEKQMKSAAKQLEFEEAAAIRDRIKELRAQQIYKT